MAGGFGDFMRAHLGGGEKKDAGPAADARPAASPAARGRPAADARPAAPPADGGPAGLTLPGRDAGQVDLGEEANASEIEDKVLLAHMEAARERYYEARDRMRDASGKERQARLDAAMGMNDLAQAIIGLDDTLSSFATAADEVEIVARQLGRWAEGGRAEPHFPSKLPVGITSNAAFAEGVASAAKTLCADAEKLRSAAEAFADAKKKISRSRAPLLGAWEGFSEAADAQSKLVAGQRELLRDAQSVFEYEKIRSSEKYRDIMGIRGRARAARVAQEAAAAASAAETENAAAAAAKTEKAALAAVAEEPAAEAGAGEAGAGEAEAGAKAAPGAVAQV